MDFFKEISKSLDLPKEQRWLKFEKILEALAKKDSLYIKNLLDEMIEELGEIRRENEELKVQRQEIESEIKEITKQKEYLTESAIGADVNTFKEIKLAISQLNKSQDELHKELDELGEADVDNDIDKQKISTFCENWGNQNSLIDLWSAAVYKIKALLADKLMNE